MLFGAHCSGGIKKALDKASEMGADTVQLFVQSPRTWRFPNHDPKDLQAFADKRAELDMPAFVHALYLVNLAAPDKEIYKKSTDTMRATVDAACAIDAEGVIFHLGSHLALGVGFPQNILWLALFLALSPFQPRNPSWRQAIRDLPVLGGWLRRFGQRGQT